MTAIEKKQNKIIEKLNQIIGCFETLLNHPYDLDSIKRLENLKSELADLKSKQSQRKNIEKVMALDEDDGLYNSDKPQPEQSAEEIIRKHRGHQLCEFNYYEVIRFMQEYRRQGMPTEEDIEKEFQIYPNIDNTGYSISADTLLLNQRNHGARTGVRWALNKWKGE